MNDPAYEKICGTGICPTDQTSAALEGPAMCICPQPVISVIVPYATKLVKVSYTLHFSRWNILEMSQSETCEVTTMLDTNNRKGCEIPDDPQLLSVLAASAAAALTEGRTEHEAQTLYNFFNALAYNIGAIVKQQLLNDENVNVQVNLGR